MACELDISNSTGLVLVNTTLESNNDNQYPVNTTVVLACDDGYHSVMGQTGTAGVMSLTCTEEGVWSTEFPACMMLQPTTSHETTTTTTEMEGSGSNVVTYVAVGIVLCMLAFGLLLLADFIRHIQRKIRIKNNSQRKLDRDTLCRPSSFICQKGVPPYSLTPPVITETDPIPSKKLSAQDLKNSQYSRKPHRLPALSVGQNSDSSDFGRKKKYTAKQCLIEVEQHDKQAGVDPRQGMLTSTGKPIEAAAGARLKKRKDKQSSPPIGLDEEDFRATGSRSNLIGPDVEVSMGTGYSPDTIGPERHVAKETKKRSRKKVYSTQEWHLSPRQDILD